MSTPSRDRPSSQLGQATPEYVGSVLLVALVLAGAATLVAGLAFGGVAEALASNLLCAVRSSPQCEVGALAATPLERAYGPAIAAELVERAPEISFEDGDFVSLPVDFRDCRERACADSIRHGGLARTQTGLSPVAYTHVVDCTRPGPAAERGYDCSGDRAGGLYLQYWLYYPDSRTGPASSITGGYHLDDWEQYGVRIGADGTAVARASSHHGYNGRDGGLGSIGSDSGWSPKAGWDTPLGALHVAAGSHAGMTEEQSGDTRHVDREDLRLIPLEPIVAAGELPGFAVSPPWEKGVWDDPEATGT